MKNAKDMYFFNKSGDHLKIYNIFSEPLIGIESIFFGQSPELVLLAST